MCIKGMCVYVCQGYVCVYVCVCGLCVQYVYQGCVWACVCVCSMASSDSCVCNKGKQEGAKGVWVCACKGYVCVKGMCV